MHRLFIWILMVLGIFSGEVQAQKSKKKTTRMSLEYLMDARHQQWVTATLRVREERYVLLSDATVELYSVNDTSRALLDKMKTDQGGKAAFLISDSPKIYRDPTGMMTFEAEYKGNNSNKGASKKISVKEANLALSFYQVDTVKSIEVNATELNTDGEEVPISDLGVSFYIQGTFSLYNFDKGKTNKEGNIIVDFPTYMPGDTVGILKIAAKVEEDKTYGTVETRGAINWGIPVPLADEKHRGLGDTDAPLWMVYTLIILLSAVWFHYLYVIFLIIKIKLSRKSYPVEMN